MKEMANYSKRSINQSSSIDNTRCIFGHGRLFQHHTTIGIRSSNFLAFPYTN